MGAGMFLDAHRAEAAVGEPAEDSILGLEVCVCVEVALPQGQVRDGASGRLVEPVPLAVSAPRGHPARGRGDKTKRDTVGKGAVRGWEVRSTWQASVIFPKYYLRAQMSLSVLDVVPQLEESMTSAVKACLGLPASLRANFIGTYLLARVDGTALPAAPERDPENATVLSKELPALASLLSKAVNQAFKDHRGNDIQRTVASYLLSLSPTAPPGANMTSWTSINQPVATTRTNGVDIAGIFARYDGDNSGSIDVKELRKALASLGIDASLRQARQILRQYDDDMSGHLEIDEFRNLVEKLLLPAITVPHDSLLWTCACGKVALQLKGEPLFDLDCHCSHCLPVALYIDHKSDGRSFGAGISCISSTGRGVAKTFYLLENVSFCRGRELLRRLKRAAGGENVRQYTSCCSTACILDSGCSQVQPWRSFNRHGLKLPDGTPYIPATPVCNANCAEHPDFASLPEPKALGLPIGVPDKLNALWSSDLEPPERDLHAGPWAPGGVDASCFYCDPEAVEVRACARVASASIIL